MAIVNRASLKTEVHVSFQTVMFSRSERRTGVAGSHGSSVYFVKEPHAVFQRGHTLANPHSECRKIPFSLCPLQHFFLGDLSDDGHSGRWKGIPQCRSD